MEVEEGILICAFRYALGRRTYVVSEVSDALIENWHRISEKSRDIIVEEINVAMETEKAGDGMDIDSWRRVVLLQQAVRNQ